MGAMFFSSRLDRVEKSLMIEYGWSLR